MVTLDANLIETGKEVKFSGLVKSQFMEHAGIPVVNAGTVDSWWITGYLPEEEIKIAVTTGMSFHKPLQKTFKANYFDFCEK